MSPTRNGPPPHPAGDVPVDPVTAFLAHAVERGGPLLLHPEDVLRLSRRVVTINPSALVQGALTLDVVPDDTYAEALHYARQYVAASRHPQGAAQAGGFLAELGLRVLLLSDVERAAVSRLVRGVLPPRRTGSPAEPAGAEGEGAAVGEGGAEAVPEADAPEAAPVPSPHRGNVVLFDATPNRPEPRTRTPRGFTPEGL